MILNEGEEIEFVKPDENFVKITNDIISQNNIILEINRVILKGMNQPFFFLKDEEKQK